MCVCIDGSRTHPTKNTTTTETTTTQTATPGLSKQTPPPPPPPPTHTLTSPTPTTQLVRDYRESRRVPLHLEQRLLLQMAPDYEKLPLQHKVEVRG